MTKWYQTPCPKPCEHSFEKAAIRQANLTKPAGSLGELENIALQFAAWQGTELPQLDNIIVRVFAGDHGICAQHISAFPQEVTMQMILNFLNGGAAISVLSKQENADFAVVNMGTVTPFPDADINQIMAHPQLRNIDITTGTADFSETIAMTKNQTDQALIAGHDIISETFTVDKQTKPDLYIGGEMGIGNTSSASAIYCALLAISPKQACGSGTGLDESGIAHKTAIIEKALKQHDLTSSEDAYDVLCHVGGLEIAALVGSYITAAQNKIPCLIDGFISTAAALIAIKLNPSCYEWFMFSHQSAEPAHTLALAHLHANPLLNLGMRLGEGSGAAVCVPLLKSALNLHNNMATFEEATVKKTL